MDLHTRRQHHTLMTPVTIKKLIINSSKKIWATSGIKSSTFAPEVIRGHFIIELFVCLLYLHQLSVNSISLMRKTTKRKRRPVWVCCPDLSSRFVNSISALKYSSHFFSSYISEVKASKHKNVTVDY